MSPSSTPELRDLVGRIELRRRQRQFMHAGGTALLGIAVIGFFFIVTTHGSSPKIVVKEPAPEVANAYSAVSLEGKAAIVYDLVTGEVLYGKNENAQLPLASLTKLLTIYAGETVLGSGSHVIVSSKAIATEGESGFRVGEEFSFNEIAKAALVGSSNDAAAAIAESAEKLRSETAASLLGSAAAAAGLSSTYALNGTGLDQNSQVSGGYGSASDIALLAGALIKNASAIARATVQTSVEVKSLSGNTYTFKNTNQNVTKIPGLLLSKTGYTELAGGNLAVVFDASINHPVAVVVLGSSVEGRFTDVDKLIRATLTSFVRLPTATP